MIKVLDHGEVELIDSMGNDESVVRAARVSHAANKKTGQNPAADAKLIRFLYKHRHTSPFEHVQFTFRVKAPLFVLRQWHRHRTWGYNEVSARYTELPSDCYVPDPRHVGVQSKDNHQARDIVWDMDTVRAGRIANQIRLHSQRCFREYRDLLEQGVPRELARTVLPLSTYSEMFATVDLHNLLKFIADRGASDAQYEIRVYAHALRLLATDVVPVTMEAVEGEES